MDEKRSSSDDGCDLRPFILPKHDLFVCEYLLSQDEADLADNNTWETLNRRVIELFNVDFGALHWRHRWLHMMENCLDKIIDLHTPTNLPGFNKADTIEETMKKANQRWKVYSDLYKRVANPLAITIHSCCGKLLECSAGKTPFVILTPNASNPPPFSMVITRKRSHTNPTKYKLNETDTAEPSRKIKTPAMNDSSSADVKGGLFEGFDFFLPKSRNVLKETERWRIILLIQMYGGTCNPREAEIRQTTIVLSTGDEETNLWKIPRWYDVDIYEQNIIYKCIRENRRLDSKILAENIWQPTGFFWK